MEVEIDHYEVLGLPSEEEGAKLTEREITKAYKIKALGLHPDKRPNDPDAHSEFQRLQASYEILKDEKARKLFDDLLQIRRDQRLRKSQHESKRRKPMSDPCFWSKVMSDLEEREQGAAGAAAPDPAKNAADEEKERVIAKKLEQEIARVRAMHAKEEERIAKQLKEDIARVRAAMHANANANVKHTAPATTAASKDKVLKVSWESGGDEYSAERLKKLFGEFGTVEDVIIRSKGTQKRKSALVFMASKDAAFAALGNVFGDLSNPLLVLPLNLPRPLSRDGLAFLFLPKKKRDGLAYLLGAGYQEYENSILDKLRKAAQQRK